jgi:hypothetical protein
MTSFTWLRLVARDGATDDDGDVVDRPRQCVLQQRLCGTTSSSQALGDARVIHVRAIGTDEVDVFPRRCA